MACRSPRGQATLELALVLPLLISMVMAVIGLSVASARHLVLHYGVHMAVREAATSVDAKPRALSTVRRIVGVAWDKRLLLPSPRLLVGVEIRDGVSRVEARLFDNVPFFPSSFAWSRLPVEKEGRE